MYAMFRSCKGAVARLARRFAACAKCFEDFFAKLTLYFGFDATHRNLFVGIILIVVAFGMHLRAFRRP